MAARLTHDGPSWPGLPLLAVKMCLCKYYQYVECFLLFQLETPGDQLISCDATTMVVRILLSPSLPRYMHTGLVLPFSECLMRPGSLSFD